MLLVNALADAHKQGLEVRLITSEYENTAQWVEKMKDLRLDEVLKIQDRVHNKGIVVDSEVAMVSSQNWSSAGVLRNRDAGVIIRNEEVAKYFEAIFLDDWANRANKKLVDVSHPATKATKKTAKKTTRKTVKKTVVKRVAVKKTARKRVG
jgi:phosphatidylserine/phosphatidylglycerophosphate/cardiolipin synthase-like enzyme